MKRWAKPLGAGLVTFAALVLLSMQLLRMTAADPVAAAAARVDDPSPSLIAIEVSNGLFGGYAKVTIADPENPDTPVVVELRRPVWSREWISTSER